jgi:type VI secretion system protein ImpG
MPADDEALRYYSEELIYLREMGAEFARTHNSIAGQLDLSAGASADPHVERLIESFAFLTARIRRNLDAEFPRLTEALLGILYPQLVQPVPSMAIARFTVDPTRLKSPTGYTVEKNTPLIARSVDGLPCRFRTCYPVNLLPLSVEKVELLPARDFDFDEPPHTLTNVLRLRVRAGTAVQKPNGEMEIRPGPKLRDLDFNRLRFFLNGPDNAANRLYDVLFASSVAALRLSVPPTDDNPNPYSIRLSKASLRPVGFRSDEDAIPCPSWSHPGYRLVQEYFHFPEKFRFFEVRNLDRLKHLDYGTQEDTAFEILFLLKEDPGRLRLRDDSFVLGCAPIINLFPKLSEPVRVDHRQLEYRLVADQRRERTTGIHSILSVSASSNPEDRKAVHYQPFYSFRHTWGTSPDQAFWTESRRATDRADLPGTDLFLSFLNLDFEPVCPADETIYAHTLCHNRDLPLDLRENAELQIESATPIHACSCLVRPTSPAVPLVGGKTAWQLISNLSLNRLSLASAPAPNSMADSLDSLCGLDALREMLRIYALSDAPGVRQQINGITAAGFRRETLRFGSRATGGFRSGNKVTLELDTDRFTGSSAILFASVLRHFLALHTSLNSFVQLRAVRKDQKDHSWKTWPPLAGDQPMV